MDPSLAAVAAGVDREVLVGLVDLVEDPGDRSGAGRGVGAPGSSRTIAIHQKLVDRCAHRSSSGIPGPM